MGVVLWLVAVLIFIYESSAKLVDRGFQLVRSRSKQLQLGQIWSKIVLFITFSCIRMLWIWFVFLLKVNLLIVKFWSAVAKSGCELPIKVSEITLSLMIRFRAIFGRRSPTLLQNLGGSLIARLQELVRLLRLVTKTANTLECKMRELCNMFKQRRDHIYGKLQMRASTAVDAAAIADSDHDRVGSTGLELVAISATVQVHSRLSTGASTDYEHKWDTTPVTPFRLDFAILIGARLIMIFVLLVQVVLRDPADALAETTQMLREFMGLS